MDLGRPSPQFMVDGHPISIACRGDCRAERSLPMCLQVVEPRNSKSLNCIENLILRLRRCWRLAHEQKLRRWAPTAAQATGQRPQREQPWGHWNPLNLGGQKRAANLVKA